MGISGCFATGDGPDGSFHNQFCDAPTSGKITGASMELNYKNGHRACKVAL
jgi:hypothetical protein